MDIVSRRVKIFSISLSIVLYDPGKLDCVKMDASAAVGLRGVKQVIVVLSGKGGVGKSSVAVQVALSLGLLGKRVGILDVDLCGPSIPRMLGLCSQNSIRQGTAGWIPIAIHGGPAGEAQQGVPLAPLKVMSISFLLSKQDDAIIWRGPKKSAMIGSFLNGVEWGELDYLVVDTPPGTSDEHMALFEGLQAAGLPYGGLLVTTPQRVALADVQRIIGFCQTISVPMVGLIENMSGYLCPHCTHCTNVFSSEGGRGLAERYEIPFLGQIPISPSLVSFLDATRPAEEGGAAAAAVGDHEKSVLEAYSQAVPEIAAMFMQMVRRHFV